MTVTANAVGFKLTVVAHAVVPAQAGTHTPCANDGFKLIVLAHAVVPAQAGTHTLRAVTTAAGRARV